MKPLRVGVISDTHGLLRPEVVAALLDVDHILHAGDVGDPAILDRLRTLAPVTAIRGNIDTHGACSELPATEAVELAGKLFYLLHSIAELDLRPAQAGIAAVISGHSHRAESRVANGVLYLNPGSVGPRRFNLDVTMAYVTIAGGDIGHEIVRLI